MESLTVAALGALLRMLQAAAEAAPTFLCGLLVAAVFAEMLGPAAVRRLFGGDTWQGLLRAWGWGMLLPVCSVGVFPTLPELRRAGLPGGTILAFALAAPLLNPLSFLYGLTLSDPLAILAFVAATLVVVAVAGLVWDRLFPNSALAADAPAEAAPVGWRRMALLALHMVRGAVGPALGYAFLALVGVGLLAAVLPSTYLQFKLKHDDPTSPLLMAAVALPGFVSPIQAMMLLGQIFDHANSVGAGFILLTLGAGMNLGTLWWIARSYRWTGALAWTGLALGSALAIAYGVNTPLRSKAAEVNHTHAFDDFCHPFDKLGVAQARGAFVSKLTESTAPHESFAALVFAALAAGGVALRFADPGRRTEAWLRRAPAVPARGDFVLPPVVLGAVALGGLVAFSVVGCYLYYPDRQECFEAMTPLRASALAGLMGDHRDPEAIGRNLRRWDDLSRKLEVGVFLRGGRLDPAAHQAAEEFREALEEARDLLMEGKHDEARAARRAVEAQWTAMKTAFQPSAP